MGLLEGIKIIDFTTYIAGSIVTRILADYKADVIKVEPLTGEPFRVWGRTLGAPTGAQENPMFEVGNANKKGISIDLKTEEGQEIMHRLLADADVFITNYRIQALETLNLTYEELSRKYPLLVYGFLNGFGTQGEMARDPGFDVISFWARGSVLGFLGEPNGSPASSLPAGGDVISGTYLVGGILAALYGRKKTGKGEKVESSLYHGAIWSTGLFNTASNYWENPRKTRSKPDSPLANSFQSQDRKWFFIGVMEYERHWPGLCRVIDRIDLSDDARYLYFENANKNSVEMTRILDEGFAKYTMEELESRLAEADIAFSRVFDAHDINRDPHALENDFLRVVTMPNGNSVPLPTSPCQFRKEGLLPWEHAPQIGQDAAAILLALGYGNEEIKDLYERSIISLENPREWGGRYVKWKKDGSIAFLRFTRPQALNAMDMDFLHDLDEVLEEIEADGEIRVVILTGEGKAFVAGADIEAFGRMTVEENYKMLEYGLKVTRKLELMKKTTIAAVNGFALGGGCELALACDIRIACDTAVFGQPEVGLGIIPGGGGTQRLPRAVGYGIATEMIVTGDQISAQRALEIGLVSKVVPKDELISQAVLLAERICKNAPIAIQSALKAIKEGREVSLDEGLKIEIECFDLCFQTKDRIEGVKAFFGNRAPVWSGE